MSPILACSLQPGSQNHHVVGLMSAGGRDADQVCDDSKTVRRGLCFGVRQDICCEGWDAGSGSIAYSRAIAYDQHVSLEQQSPS